jgi:cytochrome c oxidase subunit II
VGKFWSLVFLTVPIFGVGVFIYGAHPSVNIWLPPDVSESGHNIDHLFMFILWLTGAVFIATEGAMFWFLWKYNATDNPKPVKYIHGSHSLEVIWTILPAVTLLFIAIYQMNAWADSKMRTPDASDPNVVEIEVNARQFEWRLRYPGKDGKLGTPDDLFTVNDLHVPVGKTVLVQLKSQDVLHSFFLPNLRVKQDAVPGMVIPVWFRPMKIGIYDLPCAELCGWGHYKMKGQLTVQSETDYKAWLENLEKEQTATMPPPPAKGEGKSE